MRISPQSWILLFALSLTSASVLPALTTNSRNSVARPEAEQSKEERAARTREKLEETMLTLENSYGSTREFLDEVLSNLDIDVFYDEEAMDNAGISFNDVPLDVNYQEVRLSTLLRRVLHAQGADYQIDDGLLVITSKQATDETLTVRVYECREVVARLDGEEEAATDDSDESDAEHAEDPAEEQVEPTDEGDENDPFSSGQAPRQRIAPLRSLSWISTQGGMGGMMGGGGMGGMGGGMPGGMMGDGGMGGMGGGAPGGMMAGGGAGYAPHMMPMQDSLEDSRMRYLADTLQATVEPDSWSNMGGMGVVGTFGTKLVVRQTDEVHAEIERVLGLLED